MGSSRFLKVFGVFTIIFGCLGATIAFIVFIAGENVGGAFAALFGGVFFTLFLANLLFGFAEIVRSNIEIQKNTENILNRLNTKPVQAAAPAATVTPVATVTPAVQVAPAPKVYVCPQCGNQLVPTDKFCGKCGCKVDF